MSAKCKRNCLNRIRVNVTLEVGSGLLFGQNSLWPLQAPKIASVLSHTAQKDDIYKVRVKCPNCGEFYKELV